MHAITWIVAQASGSMIGIDPTPFTAWGVLGLLAIVLFVFLGITWKLFNKSTASMESQTKILIDFVNTHRTETNKALEGLADKSNLSLSNVTDKVVTSQDRMTSAFAKVARAIDELVMIERVLDKASKKISTGGVSLTEDDIEKIVRLVRSNTKEDRER